MFKRWLLYLLSSGTATVVDYVIFTIVMYAADNVFLATAAGRAVSMLLNFTLNRKMVFHSEGTVWKQLLKYCTLVLISGTVSAFTVDALNKWLPIPTVIIKAIVESCLFVVNYCVQRLLIFRSRQEYDIQKNENDPADGKNR